MGLCLTNALPKDEQPTRATLMTLPKHRFVTRADFDGLACAVMLKELDLIDEVVFTHPQDVIDGSFVITANDITANLPYVAAAHRVFEHGSTEFMRNTAHVRNHIMDPHAASSARQIWLHYGGQFTMPNVTESMLRAVDQACSAQFNVEDVLHPRGWILLNFLMDSRTGLGRFRHFSISNYQLMLALIDSIRTLSVDRILQLPDVRERVDLYREHEGPAVDQLLAASSVQGNVVVLDLLEHERIWATNRFMIYALHPQCNLVIRRMWGREKRNVVFALGTSIFDRTCATDIGALCQRYGGSGHAHAGTCQVDPAFSDKVLNELLAAAHHDESARIGAMRGPAAR
jgi:nanoRNase/pAp phosphatase (c-di-AMP/oligoRNAs hydrolase)